MGLSGIFFSDKLLSCFLLYAGGIENKNAFNAGVVVPILADKKYGPPPKDGVDL